MPKQDWDTPGLINALRLKFGTEIDSSIMKDTDKDRIKEDLYKNQLWVAESEQEEMKNI